MEVWVSDDASTDDTPSVLEELKRTYPALNVYTQPVNMNIAGNNTWVMAQPATDYVVRLDSDDVLEPEYVHKMVALMDRYPRAGYGSVAVRTIDERGAQVGTARLLRGSGFHDADQALIDSVKAYRVAANILMFRTAALRELDFYRNRPDFVEDYDLSIRMADAGYGNVYLDELLARYRVWTDPSKLRSKRKPVQIRGYIRIFEETLEPAFVRRGWDERIVRRRRRWLANHNASACFSPQFDKGERAELIALVKQLAGSVDPSLRLRFLALQLGLRPLFDFVGGSRKRAKQATKALLSRARRFVPRTISKRAS